MLSARMQTLVQRNGWPEIPRVIQTNEGHSIDTSGLVWRFPLTGGIETFNFAKIGNEGMRWALQQEAIRLCRTVSTHAGYSTCSDVWREVLSREVEFGIDFTSEKGDVRSALQSLVEAAIVKAINEHRLWALYRAKCWYVRSADDFPELGFSVSYANDLDGLKFPGNPKGEAVRSDDPEHGPLHRLYEMPLLREALLQDRSQEFPHLQEKAATSLFMALGRNSANHVWLNEEDMRDAGKKIPGLEPLDVIRMPRIKKRLESPRADFMDETLVAQFARPVHELIDANRRLWPLVSATQDGRPLFVNAGGMDEPTSDNAALSRRMSSHQMSRLVRRFVRRHGLISPLTGKLMQVTPRRLRYTYATALVEQGVGRKELARLLDHSDTQHVQVYFELNDGIVDPLDAAALVSFVGWLTPFSTPILDRREDGVNADRDDKDVSFYGEGNATGEKIDIGLCGKTALCNLYPPYSCYLCPKFQPYRHANHARVLGLLIAERNARVARRDTQRMGVLIDHLIVAVTKVVVAVSQFVSGPPAPGQAMPDKRP